MNYLQTPNNMPLSIAAHQENCMEYPDEALIRMVHCETLPKDIRRSDWINLERLTSLQTSSVTGQDPWDLSSLLS